MKSLRALVLLATSLIASTVYSQPELDTSFNFTGKQFTDIANTDEYGRGMIVQADNKVIVFGISDRQFGMVRYNEDGSIDRDFGVEGLVLTEFEPILHDYADAGLVQPDGKIVLAGVISDNAIGQSRFAMIRYNSDGSLDDSFGKDGKVLTDVEPSFEDAARAITMQPDGKLVLVGRTLGGNNYQAIIRYDTDGTPDPNFGNGGIVKNVIATHNAWGTAVAIQPDGKILVGGGKHTMPAPPTPTYSHTLFRLNANGSIDSSFNGSGSLSIVESNAVSQLPEDTSFRSIAVQLDGRIVAVGQNGLLIRLTANGAFDTSFDGDGKVMSAVFDARAVHVSSGGKITVAGASGSDFAVARYTATGSLDTEFSGDGNLLIDFGPTFNDRACGLAFDTKGRLVMGGNSGIRFAAARLQALAPASISGRVIGGNGRGVSGALVALDDGSGQLRYSLTNPFGFYQFAGLPAGPTYTFAPASKKHLFAPRSVVILDDVVDYDFVAE